MTTTYAGMGFATFWCAFFGQKINLRVSFLVKSQADMGYHLQNGLFGVPVLVKLHTLG